MEKRADARDWASYYARTAGRPPRAATLEALARFGGRTGFAVDLGIGGGRDARVLLDRGWRVLGIDGSPAALTALRHPALRVRCGRFETTELPPCDLVNASFSLPLCHPSAFPALWGRISAALPPGGRFAGQLYGDRDEWAGDPAMTHFPESGARALFADFEIERFEEEEADTVTPRGTPKHWHIFHIVARRA